ncbi:MAG: sulfotransferase, partial [Planctomycetota bacterium]
MRPPDHAQCVRLAQESFNREDWISAARYYQMALKRDRDNPGFLRKAALSLAQSSELDQAEQLARKACKRAPNDPDNWIALSLTYLKQEKIDQVHTALDRALRVDPDYGAAVHAKCKALLESGLKNEAFEISSRSVAGSGPHPLSLLIHARICRALGKHAEALGTVDRILDLDGLLDRHRVGALFERGSSLDATSAYDDAFEAYALANALMPAGGPMHADSVIANWTRETLEGVPTSGNDSARPVFVIGVPRSGTTLTEQIIASHPEAVGVGELPLMPALIRRTISARLTREVVAAYADEYLSLLDERADPSASRTIDKHMYGESAIGLASRMFPNASFIHCLRDPLDCCLSAFFQNFGANMPVSRDLTALGKHYVAHRRIMDHWKDTIGLPILTSVYEDLVADQDARSRVLIDHVGQEWDDACLRVHENAGTLPTASTQQVR